MGTDYAAFCPVVNRLDLLHDILGATSTIWKDLTIIDNSTDDCFANFNWPNLKGVFRCPVPLTFSQSMNLEFQSTLLEGKKFTIHMHSDAIIPDGAIQSLLTRVREIDANGRKWAVVYTFYDILAAYNPATYQAIGGYDTTLPAYFSDNDWYHRCDLAGWERINTGIEVGHLGSQTINSDPFLKNHNNVTFPLYRQYYISKWGGEPGHERFPTPFNNFQSNLIRVNR